MTATSLRPMPFHLAALALAAALVACSDPPARTPGQAFVAAIGQQRPVSRVLGAPRAAAAGEVPSINTDQLFAWAQLTWPSLFPGVPGSFENVPYEGRSYSGRAYANGNYLAVADGEAWGLGPYTNGQLVNFGKVSTYAASVCDSVDCVRAAAPGNCTLSPAESLATGQRVSTRYVQGGTEFGIDTQVDGAATFQGRDAVRITTTRRDAAGNAVAGGVSRSYRAADASGASWLLGTEAVDAAGGTSSRTVFSPALTDSEFALAAGQSVTKVQTAAVTPLAGGSASQVLQATTYSFEARERLDVQGRSYDTCRYRETPLGDGPVTLRWTIVGSGITARADQLDLQGQLLQRMELKSGSVNGAPLAPGQATLDSASAERMVTEYSYVLPICSVGGTGRASGPTLASRLQHALAARQALRATQLAMMADGRRHTLAYTSTKPADRTGDCGGRISYPSYQHVNGVTTATMRWDNYCETDSETGDTQVVDGSWSFVETARPGASGPVRLRYEASSPQGLTIIDKDKTGKVIGSQRLVVTGYASSVGVPGGDPTAANPDRLRVAEWQVHNALTGKVYRQTGYSSSTFTTAAGGEQTTISGRGYRSTGYYDLSTTSPIVTNADGDVLSGTLTSSGADGQAVVLTLVPGPDFQATMTVDGKAVGNAPACQ